MFVPTISLYMCGANPRVAVTGSAKNECLCPLLFSYLILGETDSVVPIIKSVINILYQLHL